MLIFLQTRDPGNLAYAAAGIGAMYAGAQILTKIPWIAFSTQKIKYSTNFSHWWERPNKNICISMQRIRNCSRVSIWEIKGKKHLIMRFNKKLLHKIAMNKQRGQKKGTDYTKTIEQRAE